jgi:hypothetical protein
VPEAAIDLKENFPQNRHWTSVVHVNKSVETGMKLPIPTDLRSFMEDNSNVREILEKLVSFPTVSRDTNLPLVEWVESISRATVSVPKGWQVRAV